MLRGPVRRRRCRWAAALLLGLASCFLPLGLVRLLFFNEQILNFNYYNDGQSYDDASSFFETAASNKDSYNVAVDDDSRVFYEAGQYAGAYMARRHPGNVSYCRWQYGLPSTLAYNESQLLTSPGSTFIKYATDKGSNVSSFTITTINNNNATATDRHPYRVLADVINGEYENLPQLTLCSHATADQVYGVVELARHWEGPISLAVFVPGNDAALAIKLIDRACRCEPAMSKISVHLIFPRDHPAEVTPSPAASFTRDGENCAAKDLRSLAAGSNGTARRRLNLAYPINVARNVARSLAPSQRVLVSDVELIPSEALASRFLSMLKTRSVKRQVAFVLPVFEVDNGVRPPRNKAELLSALSAGDAVYFHRFLCPHCQRFPGLTRWVLKPDPGKVRPLIITKREYPHNRWEPIFIGTKYDPLYTEEMSWEGRQDKMTQMFEMCLQNYRLIILDGAFLVHQPGIKRKPAADEAASIVDESQHAYERQNSRIYQRVTRKLLKLYPANRRCRP